jgi:hypothetical protein
MAPVTQLIIAGGSLSPLLASAESLLPGRVYDVNGVRVTGKRVDVKLDANGDIDDIVIVSIGS